MTAAEPPVLRLGRDIVRQFEHLPHDAAVEQVATHLARFWDPRMRAELDALVRRGDPDVDPLLAAAAARLTGQ